MGMSGGGLSGPLHPLAQQETVQGPLRPVEVGQPFCVLEPFATLLYCSVANNQSGSWG
jgi:hypothetical protein